MAQQLALRFEDVPVTCEAQERYHAIAPCLAGQISASEQAKVLHISYQTVTRWLRQFRAEGIPGLFPAEQYPREPYTPERVIVTLLYYKCCAPQSSYFELAKVLKVTTGQRIHHETIKALLERYFFWKYPEFRDLIHYPVPPTLEGRRLEMVKLRTEGWSEKTIGVLLGCASKTVRKWLRRAQQSPNPIEDSQPWFEELSRAPHKTRRKVYFSAIHATLELQKKYGYAGWFRIQGYLLKDFGINLGQTTVKKIMRLNRRVHLAPTRPSFLPVTRDAREGPPVSKQPFEHTYIDIRYLDAKPEGIQLYSSLLLEGHSRTILAGSLTSKQDVGVILRVYYLALLQWGRWNEVISDHGSQFQSHAFEKVNRALHITHSMYEKGHPWQNLIESQFGIQARVGEYHWARCKSVDEAVDFHRELIRDHNRLPHFAHRKRNDNKKTPLEVLAEAKGQEVDAATLHRSFSRMNWQRITDANGFVRLGRWKVYVEEGLPKTPIQVIYWDGKLRAEYNEQILSEYNCDWNQENQKPEKLSQPVHYETQYQSKQQTLFDPLWMREPFLQEYSSQVVQKRVVVGGRQLRLYFGPEAIK